jgi:phosphoribosyl 1,2-cyclic phosphate phosphodiesterase
MINKDSKDYRTRPEILVQTDEGKFLIEISPDIRLQSVKNNLIDIQDFLISHWHFDHMYGLLELHAWVEFIMLNEINLYCSQKTKEWLDINFGHIPKNIITVDSFKKFKLKGIDVTTLPVYHMKSQDDLLSEDKLNNTFGFLLEKDNKKIIYLSDYYNIQEKTFNLIKNADVIILDGTYLFEEQFPDKALQNGLKSDPDHLHGTKIIEFASSLNAKRVIFHSVTHLTEKTHQELQKLLPENMEISFDGMEIEF